MKEIEIRTAIKYENESATLFDFVMYYIKVWKLMCEKEFAKLKPTCAVPCFDQIYSFFGDIEAIAYDFTKSVIIDCDSLQYRASIIVCALISATIEIYMRIHMSREQLQTEGKKLAVILVEYKVCNHVWESFVKLMFGTNAVEHIDKFGRYLVLR